MILYTYDVFDNSVRRDGVSLHMSHGELVPVGGVRYVRLPHSQTMVVADDQWTPCRHEAKRRAAAKVQALADTLKAQARRLREEADREQTAEGLPT